MSRAIATASLHVPRLCRHGIVDLTTTKALASHYGPRIPLRRSSNLPSSASTSSSSADSEIQLGQDIARASYAKSRQRPRSSRFFPSSRIAAPFSPASSSTSGPPPRRSRLIYFALVVGAVALYRRYRRSQQPKLNDRTFTPYTIVAKHAVSPTGFILTLRPPAESAEDEEAATAIHRRAWEDLGLWTVEVKQPLIQVAREYTPLPPRYGFHGDLNLYVRAIEGGEVSNYLANLSVGDRVELRGPNQTFDLGMGGKDRGESEKGSQATAVSRDGGRAVFLAGGTGIAPAMQVAEALLTAEPALKEIPGDTSRARGEESKVTILWSNRRWSEVVTSMPPPPPPRSFWYWPFASPTSKLLSLAELQNPSPITEQLQDMQRRFGPRLDVRFLVDEAGVFLSEHDIAAAISPPSSAPVPSARDETPKSLVKSTIFLSGPDGFIAHYAGPKKWENGREMQGELGGVLGALLGKHLVQGNVLTPETTVHLIAHPNGVISTKTTSSVDIGGERWTILKL